MRWDERAARYRGWSVVETIHGYYAVNDENANERVRLASLRSRPGMEKLGAMLRKAVDGRLG